MNNITKLLNDLETIRSKKLKNVKNEKYAELAYFIDREKKILKDLEILLSL